MGVKFEPCKEEHMEAECRYWTACEYLRVVYHKLKKANMDESLKQECMLMLRKATSIAKHTTYRLSDHEPQYRDLGKIYDRKERGDGYM